MSRFADGLGLLFRVVLVVFVFVLIQLAFIYGFTVIGIDTGIYEGIFTVLYCTAVIVVFSFYLRARSRKKEHFLMLSKPDKYSVFSALVIAFGLLGLVTLYMYAATLISMRFQTVQEEMAHYSDSVDRFSDVDTALVPYWDTILDFIASVILVPLSEELVFRGAVFGELRLKIKPVVAAMLSALIFGLLHGISIHIGYAFICGIVLAMVYHFSGSIWISFIVHAVFNLMGSSLFTLLDSGIFGNLNEASAMSAYYSSYFEIVCIIPGIAGFLLLYVLYRERRKNETCKSEDEKISEDTAVGEASL